MDEKAAQDLLHQRSFIGRPMHSSLLANERDPEIRFDTKKQIAAFTSQICEVIVGKTEAVFCHRDTESTISVVNVSTARIAVGSVSDANRTGCAGPRE